MLNKWDSPPLTASAKPVAQRRRCRMNLFLANCYFAHNSSVFPVRYDPAMRNLVILFIPYGQKSQTH